MNTGKRQNFISAETKNFFVKRFIVRHEIGSRAAVVIGNCAFDQICAATGIAIHKLQNHAERIRALLA